MKTIPAQEMDALIADLRQVLQSDVQELIKSEALKAPEGGKKGPSVEMVNEQNAKLPGNKGAGNAPAKVEMVNEQNAKMKKDEEAPAEGGDEPAADKAPAPAPAAEGGDDDEGGSLPSASESSGSDSSDSDSSSSSSGSSSDSSSSSSDSSSDSSGSGDEQTLEDAYGQLSDEELQAHYEALKAVIMSRMGSQDEGGAEAPPQQAAPAPAQDKGQLAMSEKSVSEPDSSVKEELSKAEGKIAELENTVNGLAKVLETILSKPAQKSVTAIGDIKDLTKSEQNQKPVTSLTKKEITDRLTAKTKNPSLAKNDRDLINGYYMGSVKVEQLTHLLKD